MLNDILNFGLKCFGRMLALSIVLAAVSAIALVSSVEFRQGHRLILKQLQQQVES